MNAFWAFLIVIVIAVFLFVILPALFTPSTTTHNLRPYAPLQQIAPSQVKTACQEEAEKSEAALNTFFTNARNVVPEDYPRKLVGECPYSKPPSTSLPIANQPMCIAARGDRDLKV